MSLKTSFFDPMIAKKGVMRTLPLWLTHFVIWIFAMPLLMNSLAQYNDEIEFMGRYVLMTMRIGGTLMAFGFCAVITAVLWNYLYSAKSIGFYHALPVRRSTLFTTNTIVTLAVLLIPAALVGLMTQVVLKANGLNGTFSYILKWMWAYVELCVFFTGLSLFCAHMTGHISGGPILYGIFNFAAIALEYTVRYIVSLFVYGKDAMGEPVTRILSPVFNIYYSGEILRDGPDGAFYFTNRNYLLALLIVGIILTLLAFLLYRIRRSESAGEFIAIPALRPVFKYGMTVGSSLLLGVIFYIMSYQIRESAHSSIIWFTVCMTVGGMVGYFTAEMMLRKSMRVLKKRSALGFVPALALILIFGCAIGFDLFGVEGYIPGKDEIKSLTLRSSARDFNAVMAPDDTAIDFALDLHHTIIANKEQDLDLADDELSGENFYCNFDYVTFEYTLKNGKEVFRTYHVPVTMYSGEDFGDQTELSGYNDTLNVIYSDPTVIMHGYPVFWEKADEYTLGEVYLYTQDTNENLNLDPAVYGILCDALRADLLDGTVSSIITSSDGEPGWISLDMTFWIPDKDGDGRDYRYYNFFVTPESVNTWPVITDKGNYVEYIEPDQSDTITID